MTYETHNLLRNSRTRWMHAKRTIGLANRGICDISAAFKNMNRARREYKAAIIIVEAYLAREEN
jgi:hypothetical protein